MRNVMAISLFGVLGVLARYYLGLLVHRQDLNSFPTATFAINVLGSFLIGVVYVLGQEHALIPTDLRLGIMVGFLGGFTTFSAYCLESTQLLENGQWVRMAGYFVLSPVLGMLATMGGLFLTRYFIRG